MRTTSPSPAPTLRATLFSSRRPADITAKIAALEETYLKRRQRRLPIDLYMADVTENGRSTYAVTAHYTPEHAETVEFLKQQAQAA